MIKRKCIIAILLIFGLSRIFALPCGDVNSNGVIDIIDALLTAQYYVGLNPPGFDAEAADVSGNETIDIVDALLIAQYYVGLIAELPGCGPTAPPEPTPVPDPEAPPGYTWCADEEESVTFDYLVNVAYGGNGVFNYLYGVTGTITFDNDTFGDPIYGVVKKGYFQPAGPTPTPTSPPTPTPTPTPTPPGWTPPPVGVISINDPVPGWASVAGGTTGGGTDLSHAVTVSSMGELQNAVKGTDEKIVLVQPGTYNGTLSPDANTTIIGKSSGVTIHGNIEISGADKTNIIVRNMAVRQDRCSSYTECRAGSDAVYIGNGAHHIWLDHMDIADGQDGNCDITKEGDYITISWSQFHYTYDKEHAFSNLIASSNEEFQSRGKLQITYMNCWWGDNVAGRQPMGRFGKIHMLNNYHKNNTNDIHELNAEISLIAEYCYYDIPGKSIFRGAHGPTGWKGIGNEGTAIGMNESYGTIFEIPYDYTAMTATEAKAAVTSPNGGAGNTCTLQM